MSDDISLADVVRFLHRYRWLILGSGVVAGLLALASVTLLVPRTYRASATLVVVPSKFSSELKPQTLTIQGYQKLLESDAAVAETKRRLVEAGDIDASTNLRVGRNLHTAIFVSRRSEETELAPMIQIDAEFDSPTVAAKVANTWAQVFLERTHVLMSGTTSATVEFIDQQYPQAKQELENLEQQRVETGDSFQKRRNDVETSWDIKIGQVKNENSEKVAAYQAETRRLCEAFSGEHTLDTRTAQVNALRNAYRDLSQRSIRRSWSSRPPAGSSRPRPSSLRCTRRSQTTHCGKP
ncbi:MAG: Wzz/FepE/Etk N-terminal domain-containing protein [Acidobacteriota bacterium]